MRVTESAERLIHRAWFVLFASCGAVMVSVHGAATPEAESSEPLAFALGAAGQLVLALLAFYRLGFLRGNDLVPLALALFKVASAATLLLWISAGASSWGGGTLLAAAGCDVAVAGVTLGLVFAARRQRARSSTATLESPVDRWVPITGAMRPALWALGGAYASLFAAGLWYGAFARLSSALVGYAGANAVALYLALSTLALVVARAGRYRIQALDLLVGGTFLAGGGVLLSTAWSPVTASWTTGSVVVAVLHWAAAGALVLSHKHATRGNRFLGPWLERVFEQFADEVLPRENRRCTAAELTTRVGEVLSRTASPRSIGLKAALVLLDVGGILCLRTPMSRMGPNERADYVQRMSRSRIGFIRTLMGLKRPVYFLYYADERVQGGIGFLQMEERNDRAPAGRGFPGPRASRPRPATERHLECDVCVVGSGAGGAVIAARLAEAGKRVVILEEGPDIADEDITHDEGAMQAVAYRDAGLQHTRDQGMGILQGRCVGGSTKVNNAVCFDPPEATLREWDALGARFDRASMRGCVERVSRDLRTINLADHKHLVNKGSFKFVEGCERLGIDARYFDVNVQDCIGCGYCTSGCRYGKKLSVDRSYIPRALKSGAVLVSDCEAKRIVTEGRRAVRVECARKDGSPLTVAAQEVVVSCGAIGSSLLLLRSGIHRNVGTRLSFNVGSWVTAEFSEPVDSFHGFQMCAYSDGEGYCLETIAMPPGGFAAILPGGPREHSDRMRRYRYMAAAGVLVGTRATGRVAPVRLPFLKDLISPVDFRLSLVELDRLRLGLKDLCRIFLAAGAVRVFPATSEPLVITGEEDVARLDQCVREPSDLAYGSAHPQGGNPMSRDPGIGAVDTDFRVHGFRNLFVCDASVFPSSCGVNPQVMVMSLAQHAADGLVGA